MINRFLTRWRKRLFKKIRKDPIRNIFIMIIAPIMIYFVATFLFEFSAMATAGYVLVCIYGLTYILDDPIKIITWGAGYLIGAIAIGLVFTKLIPTLSQNDSTSIFAAFVILFIILVLWSKSMQIRKIKKR